MARPRPGVDRERSPARGRNRSPASPGVPGGGVGSVASACAATPAWSGRSTRWPRRWTTWPAWGCRPSSSRVSPRSTTCTARASSCCPSCAAPAPSPTPTHRGRGRMPGRVQPSPRWIVTFDVFWRIPMSGDRSSWRNHPQRRGDWSPAGSRPPHARRRATAEPDGLSYVEHIVEVARATEAAGFVGGLLPSFPQTDDPWIAAAAAARATTTLPVHGRLPARVPAPGARRPHVGHASSGSAGAACCSTSSAAAAGRPSCGGATPPPTTTATPAPPSSSTSSPACGTAARSTTAAASTRWRAGACRAPLAGQDRPEIYFSGSSTAAIDAVGRHADYYLSWLEHPDDLRAKFDHVRERHRRRRPDGALLGPGPRDRPADRRGGVGRGAPRLGAGRPGACPAARTRRRRGDSVGRRAPARLPAARRHRLGGPDRGAQHLGRHRATSATTRPSASSAATSRSPSGSTTSSRIGADAFILSGLPHLEEAYRVGEEVLPLFGATAPAAPGAPPPSVDAASPSAPSPPGRDQIGPRPFEGAST